MAKKVKHKEPTTAIGENFFIISPEKKTKILGIFLIVFALLVFLSILSFSRSDEAFLTQGFLDLLGRVITGDQQIRDNVSTINNWLGILGAYVSYFFVFSTLGYFSLIFPTIMFIWGYTILKKEKAFRVPLYLSNFLLIISLLVSTFFGMLQSVPEIALFSDVYELSGKIGMFLGTVIGKLLGGLGSIIVLSTAILITLIVAFDFQFGSILEFLKRLLKDEEDTNEKVDEVVPKNQENLDKIKNLREENKLKKLFKYKTDDLNAEESFVEPETKITIVKKINQKKLLMPS